MSTDLHFHPAGKSGINLSCLLNYLTNISCYSCSIYVIFQYKTTYFDPQVRETSREIMKLFFAVCLVMVFGHGTPAHFFKLHELLFCDVYILSFCLPDHFRISFMGQALKCNLCISAGILDQHANTCGNIKFNTGSISEFGHC